MTNYTLVYYKLEMKPPIVMFVTRREGGANTTRRFGLSRSSRSTRLFILVLMIWRFLKISTAMEPVENCRAYVNAHLFLEIVN